jgi:hypothetical protein
VTVEGGVRNIGSIAAAAAGADATAVLFGANVSTPVLRNESSIQAGASGDGQHSATAVLIAQGASVPTLNNAGTITAGFSGNHGDAVAIRDLSGTLTSLTNSGSIVTSITPNADDETAVDGSAVALDLSANTTGVTIRQFGVEPGSTVYLDDLSANVEAARAAGLRAFQYHPDAHADCLAILRAQGVQCV